MHVGGPAEKLSRPTPGGVDVTGEITVVVADDFAPTRRLFAEALVRRAGLRVVAVAADGDEALAAARQHRPALALLDLAMPGTGGLDVIEAINEACPETRIVVVSGFPGRGLEELVAARGAAAYVRKGPSIGAVLDDVLVGAGVLDVVGAAFEAVRHLPADLSAPREARRFVDEVVRRWDCGTAIETVQLLLSEIVANAVVHAGSAPQVVVRLLRDRLRVEVGDDDPTVPEPTPSSGEEMRTSGRGLWMLDTAAERWGIEPRPSGGKTVWFEVPLIGPSGERPREA